MLVASLWDQEDIYGAMAVYKAIKPKDTNNDMVYLAIGPWHHGQEIEDASSLGAIKFDSDTGLFFRQHILRPFLAQYLKDDAPKADIPPVRAFETGANEWEKLPIVARWVARAAARSKPTPLYLEPGLKLGFPRAATSAGDAAFDEYVSDPAKPVPFRTRPIQPVGYDNGLTWPEWLVDDQREASGTHRCAVLHLGRVDGAGEDQRTADGASGRVDQRDRFRLGGEADRCVSGRSGRRAESGRLSAA